jgi:hypothetical protein
MLVASARCGVIMAVMAKMQVHCTSHSSEAVF